MLLSRLINSQVIKKTWRYSVLSTPERVIISITVYIKFDTLHMQMTFYTFILNLQQIFLNKYLNFSHSKYIQLQIVITILLLFLRKCMQWINQRNSYFLFCFSTPSTRHSFGATMAASLRTSVVFQLSFHPLRVDIIRSQPHQQFLPFLNPITQSECCEETVILDSRPRKLFAY